MSSKSSIIMLFNRSHCWGVVENKGSSGRWKVKRMFPLKGVIYFIRLAILEKKYFLQNEVSLVIF